MASMLVLRQLALPLAPVHCGLGYRGLAFDDRGTHVLKGVPGE